MKSNFWYPITKFVYESHIFGVHEQKNFQKSVNIYEIKFLVLNKQFFVYLKKKLGANKQFLMRRRGKRRRRRKEMQKSVHELHIFGVHKQDIFIVYKHFIFAVYKHQYCCVYKRSIMGPF